MEQIAQNSNKALSKLLMVASIMCLMGSNATALEPSDRCFSPVTPPEDCALETTIDYCSYIYRRGNSFASCKLAAARTYENILSTEPTDFRTICMPYLLKTCDAGRKVFLSKLKTCMQN